MKTGSVTLLILLLVFDYGCASANNTTNVKASARRGVCIAPEYFRCEDVSALSGVSWYYNWGTHPNNQDHPECHGHPVPPGFVPMIWGYWGQEFPALDEYDTILGFNEPNHVDQSNLSPEQAAIGWMELQAAYPDKTLVSPSASPGSYHPEDWFEEFFEICEALGCRIDYLATHAYSGNAQHDMDYLNNLYQRYGRKIWFTEFAKPSTRDPAKELQYMKDILPYLETSEAIWRYSWFVQRWPKDASGDGWWLDRAISLMEDDSSTLTELGRFYSDFTVE